MFSLDSLLRYFLLSFIAHIQLIRRSKCVIRSISFGSCQESKQNCCEAFSSRRFSPATFLQEAMKALYVYALPQHKIPHTIVHTTHTCRNDIESLFTNVHTTKSISSIFSEGQKAVRAFTFTRKRQASSIASTLTCFVSARQSRKDVYFV